MNSIDLPAFMLKNEMPKFDLVTIGQALHWFDVENFLKIIKNDILNENGVFSVLGYFCKGFEFNLKDQNNKKKGMGYERYKEWYKIIEKYFDCDRESLEQGFGKVSFDRFFGVVEKEEFIEKREISISNFINYLKTYSAYNVYCDKFKNGVGWKDPVVELEEKINEDVASFEKNEFRDTEKPLIIVTYFFQINMQN